MTFFLLVMFLFHFPQFFNNAIIMSSRKFFINYFDKIKPRYMDKYTKFVKIHWIVIPAATTFFLVLCLSPLEDILESDSLILSTFGSSALIYSIMMILIKLSLFFLSALGSFLTPLLSDWAEVSFCQDRLICEGLIFFFYNSAL